MFPLILLGLGVYWVLSRPGGPAQAWDSVSGVLNDPSGAIQDLQGQAQTLMGTIPTAAQPYLPIIQSAAAQYGVDPIIVVALGWQETRWGTTPALDTPGPGGAGDFGGRTPGTKSHWETVPNTSVVSVFPAAGKKWYSADRVNNPDGPWVIPNDGRGWGRGLMQLDWQTAQTLQWDDAATNIDRGASIVAADLNTMQSAFPGLTYPTLVRLALAAYNAGPSRVISSIRSQIAAGVAEPNLNPDVTAAGNALTTGGVYASKVQGYIDSWGGLGAAIA